MEYQNINNFEETPRNISKEDAKLFFKSDGNIGKWIIIGLIGGIGLAIVTFILYLFSINSLWLPIIFAALSGVCYLALILLEPRVEQLNNYPLAIGYVLLANSNLYDNSGQTQAGSLIIFTKEYQNRLNAELITSIGQKIKNNQIEDIDFIHQKLDEFGSGKSVFGIDIPKPIDGVKIHCSYVILDSRNLPDGKIPESRLIPCLIDQNDRGIAVPYKFIK